MRAEHRADRVDLAFAAAAVVLGLLLIGNASLAVDAAPMRLLDYGLVAATVAGLALCRRYPVAALAVVTTAMLAFHIRVHAGVAASFPVLAVVYAAGWRGHRLAAVLASVTFLGGFLARDLSTLDGPPQTLAERTSLLLGWFFAANIAGLVTRQRTAYLEQVEQRAIEAERTREEVALRRATEERLRIARDLHDTLTHSISLIKVQAGVAVHLARKRGDEPPPALIAIQEASGQAMRELRATLEVLRAPDGEPPLSRLARVEDLVEQTRATGVPVSLTVTGEAVPLPRDTDQTAYRVVQEALTNVTKHAPGASVAVGIHYGPARLVVEVLDDGPAAATFTPGVGLTGMRERVTAAGGTLATGPREPGGFAVRVELPAAALQEVA
ncbi:MAG: sensor histidine kinase [Hamadaea sp.]|nr:sensor histidine kinase [Hamadaea sp.]